MMKKSRHWARAIGCGWAIGTLACTLPLAAHAVPAPAGEGKAAVLLRPTLDPRDAVGKDLIRVVQDQMTASSRFRLVGNAQDAGLVVRLVTLNPNRDQQEATVYGETFTIASHNGEPEAFLMTSVAVCTPGDVATCAQGVVHDLGSVLDQFLHAVRQAAEQQKKDDAPKVDVLDV